MIAVEEARAAEITAQRERTAAAISVTEYVEGTFVEQQQVCDANLAIAGQDLLAAEHAWQSNARLARRGFATPLQRQAKAFDVDRARHALALARRAKTVLELYNRPKLLTELEGRRDKAEAGLRSARAKLELEVDRLRRYQAQIAHCSIRAPQAGLAVYFNDPDRGSSGQDSPQIEEGARVHEFQVILRLPDLERMRAKVVFHESVVNRIRPGLPARLTVQGQEFTGIVEKVTNQPEPSKRRDAHIKRFAAFVRIDGRAHGLRPGETAQVELLLDHRRDVLTAPLAAVAQQGHEFYAWVRSSSMPERHRVELGAVTDEVAEIRSGLAEGDAVVLHPRNVIDEARRNEATPEPVDIARRFGVAPPPAIELGEHPPTIQPLSRHSSVGGQ